MTKRPLLILAVAALLSTCSASELYGCTCISMPLKRRFMESTDVFVGTFVAVKPNWSGFPHTAIVAVRQVLIGTPAPEVSLTFGSCTTSQPAVGREALIFGERDEQGAILERSCASVPLGDGRAEREIRTLRQRAWWWRLQKQIRATFRGEPRTRRSRDAA